VHGATLRQSTQTIPSRVLVNGLPASRAPRPLNGQLGRYLGRLSPTCRLALKRFIRSRHEVRGGLGQAGRKAMFREKTAVRKTPRYSGSAALLLALAFVQLDCGGESAVSRPGTAGSAGAGGSELGGSAGSSSAGTTSGASANGGASQTGGTAQTDGTKTGGTGTGGSSEPMGGMGDTAGAPSEAPGALTLRRARRRYEPGLRS
jgi:hypothetical protein